MPRRPGVPQVRHRLPLSTSGHQAPDFTNPWVYDGLGFAHTESSYADGGPAMKDGRVVRVRRMASRPEWLVAICGAILFVAAYPFVPAIQQFLLGPSLAEMILGLVVFLAVFAVLSRIVRRALRVTAERQSAMEGGLENAEETKNEARQLLEEHRINISEAQLEAARIREESRERGARIISEAREQALMDACLIIDDAADKIQKSRTNSLTELHPQVTEIAVKLSERILGEPPYE
jgi:F-type H+-transporting ATPase subunit b